MLVEKTFTLNIIVFGVAALVFVYRYWGVFLRRAAAPGKIHYGWTLKLLTLVHISIGILSILEYTFFVKKFNVIVFLFALFALSASQVVRRSAVRVLGKFHSPNIEIREAQEIVRSAPYSRIRHPYYASVALEVVAEPLLLNAFHTALIVCPIYYIALGVRVCLEEKVMRMHFGVQYEEYERATNRFLPKWVYPKTKALG